MEEYYVIELKGRIDSNSAAKEEERILKLMDENPDKNIEFNASGLTYISSAGLRVLMKAKKHCRKDLIITDVDPEVYNIFDVTGFLELFNVRKKYREISVDGCEVIGKGFFGTVYRLDEDTVVKKYESPEALAMIENEKRLAKLAFVAGVPTAISFDIVKIGDSYGSVFELLKAKNFNDLIIENPSDADNIIKRYVELIKHVHSISFPDGTLTSAKGIFKKKLKNIKSLLTDSLFDKLNEFISSIPEDNHLIHGDLQMKNIMLSGDEPMLIDMDTLCQGVPLFEFGGIYMAYVAFKLDDPGNCMRFFGITDNMADRIWDGVLNEYYPGVTGEQRENIIDDARTVAYISFLNILINSSRDDELAQMQIGHVIEYLTQRFS